jgi:hypothetical protein
MTPAAGVVQHNQANMIDQRAVRMDELAVSLNETQPNLLNQLDQQIRAYLHDLYRTDIYQRYAKATPAVKHNMLQAGLESIRAALDHLQLNGLIPRHNGIRFNGQFFAACGWGAAAVTAGIVFAESVVKTASLASNLWGMLWSNSAAAASVASTPAGTIVAAVAGTAAAAYFIWRMADSIRSYTRQRNEWIVEPLREAAESTLEQIAPLRP